MYTYIFNFTGLLRQPSLPATLPSPSFLFVHHVLQPGIPFQQGFYFPLAQLPNKRLNLLSINIVWGNVHSRSCAVSLPFTNEISCVLISPASIPITSNQIYMDWPSSHVDDLGIIITIGEVADRINHTSQSASSVEYNSRSSSMLFR